MFHHAHCFIASRLYKSEDPFLMVGSILPDIALTKIITWDKGLHGEKNSKKFRKFIEKNSEFINLSKGVTAHNILDDFTHVNYYTKPGYAFQNNKKLATLVAKYYGLDKKRAEGIAHNYIESAVDILLLKDQPNIPDKLKVSIQQTPKKELAKLLGTHFQADEKKFFDALGQFFYLFTKYNFSKVENWALFWYDLEKLLSLKEITTQERKELLTMAIEITKNTYKDFLAYAVLKGQKLAI